MLTIPSLAILAAACLIVFVSNRPIRDLPQECAIRTPRVFLAGVFVLGCVLRFAMLDTLPAGLSAQEALVGVQGKALWQTGAFYPRGVLTTLLPQWNAEHAGPMLAAVTAPFVGLLGLSPLAVRLPLVLLSIAAMPAAYKVGEAVSGKRAGCVMMVIYALCPYFVLGARMTSGANAALYMMPIAAALLTAGLKRPRCLYGGMLVLAMGAYTQRMMYIIAPLAVLGAAAVALIRGSSKKHALLSSLLGFAVCMPAVLTAWVNAAGLDGFMLFDLVEIPGYGIYAENLFDGLREAKSLFKWIDALVVALWRTVVGGIFQAVWTENTHTALFMPDGMLALTVVSIPLILLGAGVLVLRRIDGKVCSGEQASSRAMMSVLCAATLLGVMFFGGEGSYDIGGAPDVFDHANLFFAAALLMTAGWRQMQRRSRAGTRLLAVLLAVCFAGVGVHLFGGSYQMNANVYFDGFADASVRAKGIQEETDAKISVTSTVYPHVDPEAAAEMMYLFSVNADMREAQNFEVIYAPGVEQVDEERIYIAHANDISGWNWDEILFEEFGSFVVISAKK